MKLGPDKTNTDVQCCSSTSPYVTRGMGRGGNARQGAVLPAMPSSRQTVRKNAMHRPPTWSVGGNGAPGT